MYSFHRWLQINPCGASIISFPSEEFETSPNPSFSSTREKKNVQKSENLKSLFSSGLKIWLYIWKHTQPHAHARAPPSPSYDADATLNIENKAEKRKSFTAVKAAENRTVVQNQYYCTNTHSAPPSKQRKKSSGKRKFQHFFLLSRDTFYVLLFVCQFTQVDVLCWTLQLEIFHLEIGKKMFVKKVIFVF
jgi:hypothetical protein